MIASLGLEQIVANLSEPKIRSDAIAWHRFFGVLNLVLLGLLFLSGSVMAFSCAGNTQPISLRRICCTARSAVAAKVMVRTAGPAQDTARAAISSSLAGDPAWKNPESSPEGYP